MAYALDPRVVHLKDQHDPIYPVEHEDWYSVRVAAEEHAWDFSARLGD